MTKKTVRSHGPQTLAAQAQYLLHERCVKLWIPSLQVKIAELKGRIDEKGGNRA
jgi:hypothetical protein